MSHKQYFKKLDPAILCHTEGYVHPEDANFGDVARENGYYPPNEAPPYIPPADWPVITDPTIDDEIIILGTNEIAYTINISNIASTGWKAEIYGTDDILLITYNRTSNGALTFSCPSTGGTVDSEGKMFFIIKITPWAASPFKWLTSFTGSGYEIRIKASSIATITSILLAPLRYCKFVGLFDGLITMTNEFYGLKYIHEVVFPASLPVASNWTNIFYGSSIAKITMPSSLPMLKTLAGAFQLMTNPLLSVTFPELPEALTMNNIFNASYFKEAIFTGASDKATTIQYGFMNSKGSIVVLPTSMNGITTSSASQSLFHGTSNIKNIVLPASMSGTVTLGQIFYEASGIETVTFQNTLITMYSNIFYNCKFLKEIVLPEFLDIIDMDGFISNGAVITSFNFPWLKVSRLTITGCPNLTSINIDFANSVPTGNLNFSTNALSAVELDRIFELLPTVTSKTIYITGNPGAATCTRTIATAKGWTVTG